MNVSKVIARGKLKKSLSDWKISRFLKLSTLLFWKIECFPIKKPFSFFNHREVWYRSDYIKISDKNIVPPDGAQPPEGGTLLLF